jgi:hypothetical protein
MKNKAVGSIITGELGSPCLWHITYVYGGKAQELQSGSKPRLGLFYLTKRNENAFQVIERSKHGFMNATTKNKTNVQSGLRRKGPHKAK